MRSLEHDIARHHGPARFEKRTPDDVIDFFDRKGVLFQICRAAIKMLGSDEHAARTRSDLENDVSVAE